jgi:hypothetical protein
MQGRFAVNRHAGALWAVAEEPQAAHIVGKPRDYSLMFFEDVLAARLGEDGTLRDARLARAWTATVKDVPEP